MLDDNVYLNRRFEDLIQFSYCNYLKIMKIKFVMSGDVWGIEQALKK